MLKLKGSHCAQRWLLSTAAVLLRIATGMPLLTANTALAQDGEQTKAWKNITMIYTTDIKGKIDPCG